MTRIALNNKKRTRIFMQMTELYILQAMIIIEITLAKKINRNYIMSNLENLYKLKKTGQNQRLKKYRNEKKGV